MKKIVLFIAIFIFILLFSVTDILLVKDYREVSDVCPTAGLAEIPRSEGQVFEPPPQCCRKPNGTVEVTSEEICNLNNGIIEGPVDWDKVYNNQCGCPSCPVMPEQPEEEEKYCYGITQKFDNPVMVAYGTLSEAKKEIARQFGKSADLICFGNEKKTGCTKIFRYSSVSKEDCVVKKEEPPEEEKKSCPPKLVSVTRMEKNSNSCEEVTTMSYEDDSATCDTIDTTGYYNIQCTTKFSSSFDLGNDGMNNTSSLALYPGQGFGFKITSDYVKECVGTFNADVWNSDYDNALNNRNSATRGSAEWYKQDNIINDLIRIADGFNNWKGDINDVPNIELSIDTKPKIVVNNFVSTIESDGNASSNKVNTSSVLLRNGMRINNFSYSNKSNPRKIVYIPPITEIDGISGELAKDTSQVKVDGGNRIYTDLYTKAGTYKVSIKVNDLESNKTVNNDRCSIVIRDKGGINERLKYRIIDVTNPFVNKDYQKGENWLNSSYDYTSVIRSDTWSGSSLYTFDLTRNKIDALKKSTGNSTEKYLGTCYKSYNEKDAITQEICNIMD